MPVRHVIVKRSRPGISSGKLEVITDRGNVLHIIEVSQKTGESPTVTIDGATLRLEGTK